VQRMPRIQVAKSDRPEAKALNWSSVVVPNLGDLKITPGMSWMAEVAKTFKKAPALCTEAMVPFQEAARKGVTGAISKMAAEVTRTYKQQETLIGKIDVMNEKQTKMGEALMKMEQMMNEQKNERDEQREVDERNCVDENYFAMRRQPATPATAGRRRPQASKEGTKRTKRAPYVAEDEEMAESEDDSSDAAGADMFTQLATGMAATAEGRTILRDMARTKPEYAKFMRDRNLGQ
jgi:hypothetical protein